MASFADWNLAMGVFTVTMTILVAALGLMTIRRIVGEEREARLLNGRIQRQEKDTRVLVQRLERAPFAALSRLGNRLRQMGVRPGAPSETGDDDLQLAYLEAEHQYAPFDPPQAIEQDLARRRASGQRYDPGKVDPRHAEKALRAYTGVLRVLRDLYQAAYHVGARNRDLVATVDSHNVRMRALRRGILGVGVGYLLLVGLPLGLVAAVPTRRLSFYLIDASISLFAARVILLTLFVVTVASATTMLYLAARRLDVASPQLRSIARRQDPRAFDTRFETQDARRRARLHEAARTEAHHGGGPTQTDIARPDVARPA